MRRGQGVGSRLGDAEWYAGTERMGRFAGLAPAMPLRVRLLGRTIQGIFQPVARSIQECHEPRGSQRLSTETNFGVKGDLNIDLDPRFQQYSLQSDPALFQRFGPRSCGQ